MLASFFVPVYACVSVSFLILACIFSLRSDNYNNFLYMRDGCFWKQQAGLLFAPYKAILLYYSWCEKANRQSDL